MEENHFPAEGIDAQTRSNFRTIKGCRICGHRPLRQVIAFGPMPLADGLRESQSQVNEPRFPLTLVHCGRCSLVQILEDVDPQILFGSDYPYYASFSDRWVEHCRQNAFELIKSQELNADSLVFEIASNDGYLLQHFKNRDIPVLGIDPAPGPAAAAERLGIRTINRFFTRELAEAMAESGVQADVILANNVLAHVSDLHELVDGVRRLLRDHGVAVFEFPYLQDLIDHCEFDTIYHEHHCYFSLTSLKRLFEQHSLYLQDVRRLPTHGGSLRLYVGHHPRGSEPVEQLLKEEQRRGLIDFECVRDFAVRVQALSGKLRALLSKIRQSGKRTAAYAAAAKGAMLLNVTQTHEFIEYVVDRNVHKQGRFMPGTRLQVRQPDWLLHDQPDYLLLLAWNLQQEIVEQQTAYLERGGKIIVPVPDPKIL